MFLEESESAQAERTPIPQQDPPLFTLESDWREKETTATAATPPEKRKKKSMGTCQNRGAKIVGFPLNFKRPGKRNRPHSQHHAHRSGSELRSG